MCFLFICAKENYTNLWDPLNFHILTSYQIPSYHSNEIKKKSPKLYKKYYMSGILTGTI